MPARWAALRCSGTNASMRSSRASEAEYPKIFVAVGFQRTICWLLASATMTASRIIQKSLPMPKSCGCTFASPSPRRRRPCDFLPPQIRHLSALPQERWEGEAYFDVHDLAWSALGLSLAGRQVLRAININD